MKLSQLRTYLYTVLNLLGKMAYSTNHKYIGILVSHLGYKYFPHFYSIFLPILFYSLLSLYFPLASFLFLLILSFLSLGFTYQSLISKYLPSNHLALYSLFNFLEDINVLDFFYKLYSIVFETSTLKRFFTIIFFCNFFVLVYAVCLRYYLYQTFALQHTFTGPQLFLIYFIFCIGFFALYMRSLISFSIIIVNTGFVLRTQLPDMPEGNNSRSIFTYDKSIHHHQHNHTPPPYVKIPYWRSGLFWSGLGTLAIGSGALYYNYKQTMLAQAQLDEMKRNNDKMERQNNEMKRNNDEMERQNDLEERSQNIITPEEYCRRYPRSCLSNNIPSISPTASDSLPPSAIEKHFPEIPSSSAK